jgi:hypothetical protein
VVREHESEKAEEAVDVASLEETVGVAGPRSRTAKSSAASRKAEFLNPELAWFSGGGQTLLYG